MARGCDIKDTASLACHASAQPQLCLATGGGIRSSCCADGTQEKARADALVDDPGAPSSESDGGTGAPRRLGVTCHVIHDGQTRLPGWAYWIRTGESGRGPPDCICGTIWSEVGAIRVAESLRAPAAWRLSAALAKIQQKIFKRDMARRCCHFSGWPIITVSLPTINAGSLSAQTRPFFLLLSALLLCRLTSCISSIARRLLLGSYSCLLFGF
jgi:hypothetical protein